MKHLKLEELDPADRAIIERERDNQRDWPKAPRGQCANRPLAGREE